MFTFLFFLFSFLSHLGAIKSDISEKDSKVTAEKDQKTKDCDDDRAAARDAALLPDNAVDSAAVSLSTKDTSSATEPAPQENMDVDSVAAEEATVSDPITSDTTTLTDCKPAQTATANNA